MGSTVFGGTNSGLQVAESSGTIIFNDSLDDRLLIVPEASFDSDEDQHENECLQGTRTDLLHQINEWAFSSQGKPIFWLGGMAGTGKSTISRTIARSFNDAGLLGASFFFKRGEAGRGNAKKLFSTIARQLGSFFPEALAHIRQAVNDDPAITRKNFQKQLSSLIIQPLLQLKISRDTRVTVVIVIDALDECGRDDDMRLIIQLLPQLQDISTICVRVFLTSRPEIPIRREISEMPDQSHQDFILHEIPLEVTAYDISLFLKHRFMQIKREKRVSGEWPGDRTMRKLVELSVPLFISAATLCRHIERSRLEPTLLLKQVLKDQSRYANQMEKTYLPILTQFLELS